MTDLAHFVNGTFLCYSLVKRLELLCPLLPGRPGLSGHPAGLLLRGVAAEVVLFLVVLQIHPPPLRRLIPGHTLMFRRLTAEDLGQCVN